MPDSYWEAWIDQLEEAVNTNDPRSSLKSFFLEWESKVYNKALTDVAKNINATTASHELIDQVLAMCVQQSKKELNLEKICAKIIHLKTNNNTP